MTIQAQDRAGPRLASEEGSARDEAQQRPLLGVEPTAQGPGRAALGDQPLDKVLVASMDSFPASDAPGWIR